MLRAAFPALKISTLLCDEIDTMKKTIELAIPSEANAVMIAGEGTIINFIQNKVLITLYLNKSDNHSFKTDSVSWIQNNQFVETSYIGIPIDTSVRNVKVVLEQLDENSKIDNLVAFAGILESIIHPIPEGVK